MPILGECPLRVHLRVRLHLNRTVQLGRNELSPDAELRVEHRMSSGLFDVIDVSKASFITLSLRLRAFNRRFEAGGGWYLNTLNVIKFRFGNVELHVIYQADTVSISFPFPIAAMAPASNQVPNFLNQQRVQCKSIC